MSEYVYLFRTTEAERNERMGTPERAQQSMQAWLGWMRELEAKGHVKNPGQPLEVTGKVVRAKKQVVDGPFVEAKDLIAGFMGVNRAALSRPSPGSSACTIWRWRKTSSKTPSAARWKSGARAAFPTIRPRG
jgi:hypothetical protein